MSVATSTAIGLGIAGAAGVATSAIGAHEAGQASQTQANAANNAAGLQAQEAQNALDFQKQQFYTGQQNLAPYLQSGYGALNALDYGLGIGGSPQSNLAPYQAPQSYNGAPASTTVPMGGQPSTRTPLLNAPNRPTAGVVGASANTGKGQPVAPVNVYGGSQAGQPTAAPNANPQSASSFGSLLQPYSGQFEAPTAEQAAQTPGYQFQLQQGLNAIQNSAFARGGGLSGNTAEALNNYAQGTAASNYQNTYSNALTNYTTNYNQWANQQQNEYNRLAGIAGTGQTAAGQLNSAGQAAANNVGNISQTAGAQIGQNINNAGAATASGYAGTANALNGGINSIAGSAQQGLLLSQLLNNGGNAPSSTNVAAYDPTGGTYYG